MKFFYLQLPEVSGLNPLSGSESGGWIVTFNSSNLFYKSFFNLACRFANEIDIPLTGVNNFIPQGGVNILAPQGGVSRGQISCPVPALSRGSNRVELVLSTCSGSTVTSKIRSDGERGRGREKEVESFDKIDCETIYIYIGSLLINARVTTTSIYPTHGPSQGSKVKITGTGFDQIPLCCEMNGHLHLAINSTATVTYCTVPPKPSLLNLFDYSN